MVRLSDDGQGTKSWMMENASGGMAMTRWSVQVRTLHARVSPSNDTSPSRCLGEPAVEVSGDLEQALLQESQESKSDNMGNVGDANRPPHKANKARKITVRSSTSM